MSPPSPVIRGVKGPPARPGASTPQGSGDGGPAAASFSAFRLAVHCPQCGGRWTVVAAGQVANSTSQAIIRCVDCRRSWHVQATIYQGPIEPASVRRTEWRRAAAAVPS